MAIAEITVWSWQVYNEIDTMIDTNRLHAVNRDEGALAEVEVMPRPGDVLEEGVQLAITLAQRFTTIYRDVQTEWLFWVLPNDTAEQLIASIEEIHQHPRKQTREEIADLNWHIREHEKYRAKVPPS